MSSWTPVSAPDVEAFPVFAHAAVAGDHISVSGMLGLDDAYLDVFGERPPARIAIGCASLPFGARVEFDCVAYSP